MNSSKTIMMLQMMASFQTVEELVNSAIEDLEKYKKDGYKDNIPFASIVMLITKWEQGGKSMEQIMKRSVQDQRIVSKAIELIDDEEDHPEGTPMGEHGKA